MFCQIQTSKLRVNNLQSVILITLEVLTNPNTSLKANRLSKFLKSALCAINHEGIYFKFYSSYQCLYIMFSRLVTIT